MRLPLITLFQAPTVSQLVRVLQHKDWQPTKSALVPIQPQGSSPPFFCVTPPRGSVLGFSGLAQHLGQDQPFYGLHYKIQLVFQPRLKGMLESETTQLKQPNKYSPMVYAGRITLFQTSDATEAAWSNLTNNGVDLHLIPGSHLDVFHEPNVQLLAKKLTESIVKAQQTEISMSNNRLS